MWLLGAALRAREVGRLAPLHYNPAKGLLLEAHIRMIMNFCNADCTSVGLLIRMTDSRKFFWMHAADLKSRRSTNRTCRSPLRTARNARVITELACCAPARFLAWRAAHAFCTTRAICARARWRLRDRWSAEHRDHSPTAVFDRNFVWARTDARRRVESV